jgi:hypothetical protein
MGWCSGTEIFDNICSELLTADGVKQVDVPELIHVLVLILQSHDWDCEQDSEYFDNPVVQKVMKELHPHWFEENSK